MLNILTLGAAPVIIASLLTLVLGLIVGFFVRVITHDKSIREGRELVQKIVEDGRKEAEKQKRDAIMEAKQEIFVLRKDFDEDTRERRKILVSQEEKVGQREVVIDKRAQHLDRRDEMINAKEARIEERREELEQLNSKAEKTLQEHELKLIEIANMTIDEAKEIIFERVKDEVSDEIAQYIRDEEESAKMQIDSKAKNLLALAMQKFASETTAERTVSVVTIPNDDMKGRIIGREGRNIRTLEALTGVDLIIDDTPEAVVLSGFDPIRREIAKRALETLVQDGRIHPGRIEEVVEKAREEVDTFIRETGENAVFEAQVSRIHPDLIKLLGRMNFRTSYGQNVLKHSIETAFLAGKLAAEIGENETLARRAGLLHDIGKAVDHEVEGSHVEIGVNLAKRYKEPKEVIDAIASHHGDVEPESIIAVLVAAADALSAARPGSRSESIDAYMRRLEQLEEISNNVEGVDKSYAIQAGREIRVIVKSDQVDDLQTYKVAREIKNKIEETMSYPGTIKVTVIRETRATDVAK